MKKIHVDQIADTVKELIIRSSIDLPKDLLAALEESKKAEESPTGIEILTDLIKNAQIARRERMPVCKDTGMAILFLEIGQEVQIIGIGGDLKKAALIAKKSLFRKIGQKNPRLEIAQMEKDLLNRINRLGIGPGGLGGRVTALAVFIETFPTHIASLPLAVNIQCNAHRHQEAII